ncbi:MAG: guanylate kinase [Acidobacteriia bacterium]|nr:guanylate kinase [Terriglobia bacterium]
MTSKNHPHAAPTSLAEKAKGLLFIVSAPSGSGKSTLVQRVLHEVPHLCFSVSHTTRPPRAGERNGVEYFFVSPEDFESMVRRGEFVEHAKVFGNDYGTTWKQVEEAQASGDVLLDIDVQGAAQVKQRFGEEAPSVFLLPPSFEVLEERLRGRSSDGDAVIQKRLETARREIREYSKYDYVIVNDDLDRAAEVLRSIIQAQRARQIRQREEIRKILKSFGGNIE